KPAPAFALPDQEGKVHKLSDYKGKYVVLFFYPKDSTPGCTLEACGCRDLRADFEKAGAVIFGVSILDSASKAKFARKHNLNFPLLADEDHKVAEAYGVWKQKSFMGKKYMGVSRETFVIAPDGKIAMHWPEAKGSGSHSEEVLGWVRGNR